jgi:4'-phosphopantetheinyl transferase
MSVASIPIALTEADAHVWYAWTAACDTPVLRAGYRRLLGPDEVERLGRLASDRLKLEYLVTRALCRTVLSAYTPEVAPAQWRFRTNAYGRPEIDPVAAAMTVPLRFNLSNAGSVVACVVTRSADAGIDVEDIARRCDVDGIAGTYFAASEQQMLKALPAAQRRERFFDIWTLKESYIKARGVGLSIDLAHFSFDVSRQPIRVIFEPEAKDDAMDDARDWQFALLDIGARHRMALGIRRGSRAPLQISMREIVPMAATRECSLLFMETER